MWIGGVRRVGRIELSLLDRMLNLVDFRCSKHVPH
jgi:hypothetical protein